MISAIRYLVGKLKQNSTIQLLITMSRTCANQFVFSSIFFKETLGTLKFSIECTVQHRHYTNCNNLDTCEFVYLVIFSSTFSRRSSVFGSRVSYIISRTYVGCNAKNIGARRLFQELKKRVHYPVVRR